MNPRTGQYPDTARYRIENWWIGQTNFRPFRAFEVLFATSYICSVGTIFTCWQEWFTNKGFHIHNDVLALSGRSQPLPLPPLVIIPILLLVTLLGSLFVILNKRRRSGLCICFLSSIYYQGIDIPETHALNSLYTIIFGFLLIMPGYKMEFITRDPTVSNCNIRITQACLIAFYMTSGITKILAEDWLKYNDVLRMQLIGPSRTEFAAWCLTVFPGKLWTFIQYAGLSYELLAFILLALSFTRRVAIFTGVVYNLIMVLLMKSMLYYHIMIFPFFAVFLTACECRTLVSILFLRPFNCIKMAVRKYSFGPKGCFK